MKKKSNKTRLGTTNPSDRKRPGPLEVEKKSNKAWLGITVLIMLLVFLGLGAMLVFRYFQPETLLALIVGLMPSIIFLWTQKNKEKREHANWVLRNREAYLLELVRIFTLFLINKGSDESKQKKLMKQMEAFRPGLLVWGSPSVLELWNDLLEVSKNPADGIKKGERMLRTIRKELGQDDSSLTPGAIMATLIKAEERQQVYEVCKGEIYE